MTIRTTLFFVLLFAALTPGVSHAAQRALKVGIYAERGAVGPEGVETLASIVRDMPGATVDLHTSVTFRAVDLSKYDVLMFPGGSGKKIAGTMGPEAVERVRDYIRGGGGAVGVCAGAYFLSDSPKSGPAGAEMLNAKVFDRAHWNRGKSAPVVLELLPDGAAPATTAPAILEEIAAAERSVETLPKSDPVRFRTMRYHQGPPLTPDSRPGLPGYVPLARFRTDVRRPDAPAGMLLNRDAIVAATSGAGKIVAISPHPESSPELRHWIANSVRWVADKSDKSAPTVAKVLEGKR